ncbi:MAG: helix-turn-helix transcriptional regulator [Clostridia bacterium]|nr:helix-turn-helix transcriptional regulator [Clostridia bacterium]
MELSQREFLRKLGKEICAARKRLNMSQEELAEKADLSVTYISKIECGHRNFSVHTMAKIAQVLELPQYKMIEVTCCEKYNELLKEIFKEYSFDEIEDIAQILQSINRLIVKRPLK